MSHKSRLASFSLTLFFQPFAKEASEQCALLKNMLCNMETLYADLAEFYAFDKQKYPLEEFFTDLKTFKDAFMVSYFNFIISLTMIVE